MLYLNLNKQQGRSICQQIYEQIQNMILNGELKAGEKLASTREMARVLNVSRNTVITAYEMLASEGFVISIPGCGVFVNQGAEFPKAPETLIDYNASAFSIAEYKQDHISFDSGTPALELFPRHKWNRIASQIFREAPISVFGYDYPQGRPELRKTLAAYLKKTRGINCHPDQIIITAGAKQALTLVAKCLLHEESEVWIEDPSNRNVKKIFSYHTSNITPIPVDHEGIQTHMLPKNRKPAFIFVTPSHQFPMGGILSIQRRLELIRCIQEMCCYIVEDDYDSEFKYKGLPINSLYSHDHERVIYIGTFSKILFPSLRLGYIVLPFSLVEQFREWKRLTDHHSNSLNQLALMRFMESGELERHILRMKKVYLKRRNYLIEKIHEYFPNAVRVIGEAAGMHIVTEFSKVNFSPKIIEGIKKANVNVIPVEDHAIVKGRHKHQIILGYAHLEPSEIEQGLSRLKNVIDLSTT